ncbi:MAG: oligoendopeptidase F, partial [Methylocystis sp.]|nr:oligoendopeptidase F [Methylocystis sp.]
MPSPLYSPPEAVAALPEWNLADLYESPDSPKVAADIAKVAEDVARFGEDYRGKLAKLAAGVDASDRLGAAVARYEALQDLLGRLMAFAGLLY